MVLCPLCGTIPPLQDDHAHVPERHMASTCVCGTLWGALTIIGHRRWEFGKSPGTEEPSGRESVFVNAFQGGVVDVCLFLRDSQEVGSAIHELPSEEVPAAVCRISDDLRVRSVLES